MTANTRIAVNALSVALESMVAEIVDSEQRGIIPVEHLELVGIVKAASQKAIKESELYLLDDDVAHMEAAMFATEEANSAMNRIKASLED